MTLTDLGLTLHFGPMHKRAWVVGTATQDFVGAVDDSPQGIITVIGAKKTSANSRTFVSLLEDRVTVYVKQGDTFTADRIFEHEGTLIGLKGLSGSFSLEDVRSAIIAEEGTAGSADSLEELAAITPIYKLVEDIPPTRLSDWRGYPVEQIDHYTYPVDVSGLYHLHERVEGILSAEYLSYGDGYDHAGDLTRSHPDYVYSVPKIDNSGMLRVVFDVNKTADLPQNTLRTKFADLYGRDGDPLAVSIGSAGKRVPKVTGGAAGDYYCDSLDYLKTKTYASTRALYILSDNKLTGDTPFIVPYSHTLGDYTTVYRRFYPLIGGAKATGYIRGGGTQHWVHIDATDAQPFVRGGYMYRVTTANISLAACLYTVPKIYNDAGGRYSGGCTVDSDVTILNKYQGMDLVPWTRDI